MTSRNIILPPYQRYFVWNEEKIKTLIDSIRNEEYVPSVTIGAYKHENDKIENLIIDG